MGTRAIRRASLLGTLVLVWGALNGLSLTAFAATSVPPTVTVNGATWVQVSNAGQLEYIDQNQDQYLASNIELMGNIDLAGYTGWVPIGGNETPGAYSGTFDGQGHAISGLIIGPSLGPARGFFGASSGTIENLSLNVRISDSKVPANTIETSCTGGLVGHQLSGSITRSDVSGQITGANVEHGIVATGGLVGVQCTGCISDSYSSAKVTGGIASLGYVLKGGLVGTQKGGVISDSYATGYVAGRTGVTNNPSRVSFVGGLVGLPDGKDVDSFFDDKTTDQASGAGFTGPVGSVPGLTGESNADMKKASTFVGWDFSHTWGINADVNGGYPYLLASPLNPGPAQNQMPEVPFAGVLPVLGMAGLGAAALIRRGRRARLG
ncbi:MAG: hypothetical protein OWT27_08185 [Firmicutes bacterium]|nr:hypothetical protein [Bacillota bacterium]